MPIYEYKCEKCNASFEKLVFKGDNEQVICPECGFYRVKWQLTAGSILSGSGGGFCSSNSSTGFS